MTERPRGLEYVIGQPQTRVCECDRPAVLERAEGRCVKCGYQAEPDTAPVSVVFACLNP